MRTKFSAEEEKHTVRSEARAEVESRCVWTIWQNARENARPLTGVRRLDCVYG